ncbi:hypothetical protein [Streptomyces shaanxiensis]|uniref:Uncharacterized protein n=1 Tax=Streptomyces shaanxiensis TaxID=653357 RepID=A0ABP7UEY8_9ACTN
MFGTLLESVGKDTTSKWLTLIRAPAVVFWVIGAFTWWLAHPDVDVRAWLRREDAVTLLALLVVAAALLIGTSVLMDQLARPLLRLLEGYWPPWLWLRPFRIRLIARAIDRQREWYGEWRRLDDSRPAATAASGPTPTPSKEVAASAISDHRQVVLDQLVHEFPADEVSTMPTRVGNILRSSETYPKERYGLDAVIVWPALWLVLPETTRDALGVCRRSLDQSVSVVVALAATLVWLPWSWLVLIPAVLGPPVVHQVFVIPRAQAFAQVVRASFDIHRLAVYTSLRFPTPTDPDAEPTAGAHLTSYLWRGFSPQGLTFTPASPEPPPPAGSGPL